MRKHSCNNSNSQKKRAQFARYGLPDISFSDNGPQFNCVEFRKFAKDWDFSHETSSPLFQQSNGKVEHAVQTNKSLIKKTKHSQLDPYWAILDIRNTPTEGFGSSSAQRLMNRRTQTLLPAMKSLLKPKIEKKNIHKEFEHAKQRQTYYYNQGAKELSSLKEGDIVRKEPNKHGKCLVKQQINTRSYEVYIEGKTFRRNRRHLP